MCFTKWNTNNHSLCFVLPVPVSNGFTFEYIIWKNSFVVCTLLRLKAPSFPFQNILKQLKPFLFRLSLWVGANSLKAVCKWFLGLGSHLWLYCGQITQSDPPDAPKEPAHQHTIYKLFYVKGSKLFIYPFCLICPCLQTKTKWLDPWVRLRLLNWTLTNSVWADINVSNGLR
jgi:hypothetical protein